MAKEFKQEMQRFLPAEQISQTLAQENFLAFYSLPSSRRFN